MATSPPSSPSSASKPPTSRLAVLSLVFGVLGWGLLPGLGSVLAIVSGHLARSRIDASTQPIGGRRLAVAGLALGYAFVISAAVLAVSVLLGVLLYVGSATRAEPELDVVHRALEEMPEGASVESRVILMIAEQLGYDEDDIRPGSSLIDVGLDDEDRLDLIDQVRDEFGVPISEREVHQMTTVAELAALIEQRQRQTPTAPAVGPAPKPASAPPK